MAETSYIKTVWRNNVTKLNADNMNHIENGIEALGEDLKTKLDKSNVVQATGQSTTAVMSQKATTDEINALKSDLDDVKDVVTETEILENYGKLTDVYTTTGYNSYTGWYSTDFISVSDNKISKILVCTYRTIYAVSFFDNEYNFISGILPSSSDSNTLTEIRVNQIPNDAVYFKVAYMSFSNVETNKAISFMDINSIKDDVITIKKEINIIEEHFDKTFLTRREVYTDDGWKDYTTWYSTYLDVSDAKIVKKATCTTYGLNIYSYCFFDENNNFISGHKEGVNKGWTTFTDITVPQNAKYLSCIGASNEGTGLDNFIVEIYKEKSQQDRYDEFLELNKEFQDTKAKVDLTYNKYLGMYFDNILCIGDSLTQGDYGSYPEGTANVHKWNYPSYLAEITRATVTNKGHCGATCVSYWNNDVPTIDITKEYEAIYIFLGTNGGLSDTINTDAIGDDYRNFNQTTQTGAYCSIVSWCKEKFPNAKIFLLNFPYNSRSESWTNSNSAIVAKIGEKFNVPVLDIMNKSPFTRDNGQIYRPVGYDETLEPYGNLHFGRLGYLTLANVVCELTVDEIEKNPLDYALGY